jgi:hypothetical protein
MRLKASARAAAARCREAYAPCPQQRACGPRHTPSATAGARAQRRSETEGFREGAALRAPQQGVATHTHTHSARAACAARYGQRSAAGRQAGGGRAQRQRCGARAVACAAANHETLAAAAAHVCACVVGRAPPRTACDDARAHNAHAAATRAWPGSHARRGARGGREGGGCSCLVAPPQRFNSGAECLCLTRLTPRAAAASSALRPRRSCAAGTPTRAQRLRPPRIGTSAVQPHSRGTRPNARRGSRIAMHDEAQPVIICAPHRTCAAPSSSSRQPATCHQPSSRLPASVP